jgi:hypothetical protein
MATRSTRKKSGRVSKPVKAKVIPVEVEEKKEPLKIILNTPYAGKVWKHKRLVLDVVRKNVVWLPLIKDSSGALIVRPKTGPSSTGIDEFKDWAHYFANHDHEVIEAARALCLRRGIYTAPSLDFGVPEEKSGSTRQFLDAGITIQASLLHQGMVVKHQENPVIVVDWRGIQHRHHKDVTKVKEYIDSLSQVVG